MFYQKHFRKVINEKCKQIRDVKWQKLFWSRGSLSRNLIIIELARQDLLRICIKSHGS